MNIKTQNPSPQTGEAALLKATSNAKIDEGTAARPQRLDRGKTPKDSYSVSLSPESQELKEARTKAFELAMSTPDVREERVKALKDKIQNGSYEIDSGKIADGMLREAIKDKLAGGEP